MINKQTRRERDEIVNRIKTLEQNMRDMRSMLVYPPEIYIPIAVNHRWSDNTAFNAGYWEDEMLIEIDCSIWVNWSPYYEVVMRASDTGLTAETKLYNVTDAALIDDSLLQVTYAESLGDPIIKRTLSKITLPQSGVKTFQTTYRRQGGSAGQYADVYKSSLVFKFEAS